MSRSSVLEERGLCFTLSKSLPEMTDDSRDRQHQAKGGVRASQEEEGEIGKVSPAVSGRRNTIPAARKLTEARMRTDCSTEVEEETTKGEKKPPTCDIKHAIECPVTRNSVGNNSGAATHATVLIEMREENIDADPSPSSDLTLRPWLQSLLRN
jgi:hypothetical protein